MFFELFADTGAKERGPEPGGSLTKLPVARRCTEETSYALHAHVQGAWVGKSAADRDKSREWVWHV